MDIELLYLVNEEVRKIRTQTYRIESIVRKCPYTRFYSINYKSTHKEWIIYEIHGGRLISYPALIKPVKLLTYLLLTDV